MIASAFFPPASTMFDLKAARFRAGSAYELILFDRLPKGDQHALRGLADDPDCYGVLRPRENSSLNLKAVSRDIALLFFSLVQPGPLPRFAVQALGDDCASVIGRMVLDGILEIEVNGEMLSGPDASSFVGGPEAAPDREGALAAISRRAVEYAAALQLDDPVELAARLYSYNCMPTSRRWRSSLPSDAETASFLGLTDGTAARVLSGKWRSLPESPAWISWRARDFGWEQAGPDKTATAYKLYVSPVCDRLQEAVNAVAASVSQSNAIQWKVGKGVYGLLRSDKIVVYFNGFADLQEVALNIMQRLAGCAAHGVPFTAELAEGGLLSWGIAPPTETHNLSWLEQQSWRGKLCDRLATALVQAGERSGHRAPGDTSSVVSSARFAIQRTGLEGIDTNTWTPKIGFEWAS